MVLYDAHCHHPTRTRRRQFGTCRAPISPRQASGEAVKELATKMIHLVQATTTRPTNIPRYKNGNAFDRSRMGFERFHQVQWRSHTNASNSLRKNSTLSCFPIGRVWPYEIGAKSA